MANEYATLTELKSARRITDTDDDTELQNALTRASRAIDKRCGRRFWLDGTAAARTINPAGRTIAGRDGERLLVADIGSTIGLAVEIGRGSDWTAVTADVETEPTDALALIPAEPITRLLYVNGGFWRRTYTSRVRVTARWGWPEVPDPIVEATLLLANRRFMRRDSPEGVAGWSDQGPVRVSRFDPDIEDLVEPYVLPGIA